MNYFNSINDTEPIQSKHKLIISQIICMIRQNLSSLGWSHGRRDKYIHSCTGVGHPVDDQVWLKHVVDL